MSPTSTHTQLAKSLAQNFDSGKLEEQRLEDQVLIYESLSKSFSIPQSLPVDSYAILLNARATILKSYASEDPNERGKCIEFIKKRTLDNQASPYTEKSLKELLGDLNSIKS